MAPAQAQHAHAELIDALTELYTLLDTLGALSPLDSDPGPDYDSDTATPTANVLLPPNPASSINAIAATAAGFAPETVSVMSKLPFLTSDYTYSHGDGYELMPSTYPLSYLGEDLDEGGFESRRELLSDQVMPPTALKLTQSDVYGVEWIYDVATGVFWTVCRQGEVDSDWTLLQSLTSKHLKDFLHHGSHLTTDCPTQMTTPISQPSHGAMSLALSLTTTDGTTTSRHPPARSTSHPRSLRMRPWIPPLARRSRPGTGVPPMPPGGVPSTLCGGRLAASRTCISSADGTSKGESSLAFRGTSSCTRGQCTGPRW